MCFEGGGGYAGRWEKTLGGVWTHLRARNQCYVSFNFSVTMPSASPVLPAAQLLCYSTGHSPAGPSAWPAAWHISFLKGDKSLFVATEGHYNIKQAH